MKAYKIFQDDRKDDGDGWRQFGPECVYRVEPPITGSPRGDDNPPVTHSHVFVSQAAPLGQWETCIFPADETGEVTDWGELDGGRKGYVTPDDLMREIGYEVVAATEGAAN